MRTLTKTLTYAFMHLTVAVAVAYAVSGDWTIALSIGLLEPTVQTVFYAFHEKLWGGGRIRMQCGSHGRGHRGHLLQVR